MEVIVSSEGGEHVIVPAADKIVFPKVHYLHLQRLPSFTALCKDMIAIEMPELETLFLWKMPKLQYIWCPPESNHNSVIQSLFHNKVNLSCIEDLTLHDMDDLIEIWHGKLQVGEGHPAIALSCLKKLKLKILPKLTHVWTNNSACSQGFQNLISISVQKCGSLRNLFSYSMAKHLVKLQKLKITECEVIEAIIAHEQEVDEEVTTNTIIFPQLTVLTLEDLPNLTSFFQQDYAFEGSVLKRVKVIRCPKMKELSLKHCDDLEYLRLEYLPSLTHFWMRPSQFLRPRNLRYVAVMECEKLKSVFSFFTENPKKMEVIVSTEGGELPKLNELLLRGLPRFTAFYDPPIVIELSELRKLLLEKIPKLQYLFRASKSNSYSVIQSLFHNQVNLTSIETLFLWDMDNLIEIWPGELQAKLKNLFIINCQKLPNILFSSNLIECMQNLEDIEVTSCESVEVAFDLGGLDVGEGHPAITLSYLEKLELKYLPKLTDVWVNNSPCSQGFQNLWSVIVVNCDSLRNLFSPSIAKLLVKLQRLEVTECKVMETIIAQEQEVDEEVTTNTTIFSHLTYLKLKDLPNLTSFCKQDYTFEGSFLEGLEVSRCPKMEALPSALQRLREQYDMQDVSVRNLS
ncbi:hypothetical protein U1Q18_007846 [Sarracenia purpurea var. burkii]